MNDEKSDAKAEEQSTVTPPTRRRVLLFALAPVAILLLLTAGVRLANEAAARQERQESATDVPDTSPIHRPRPPKGAPRIAPITVADRATQHTVERLIRNQLVAITASDFEDALQYSSPDFRNSVSPEQFRAMIYSRYSPMASMRHVSFKAAQIHGGGLGFIRTCMIEADVETQSGTLMKYGYTLLGDASGWSVEGVVPMNGMPMGVMPPENMPMPMLRRPEPGNGNVPETVPTVPRDVHEI